MVIQKDTLVTIAVAMYDLQGNELERTPEGGISYVHGHQDIFPELEKKLEGHKPGDEVTVVLEPEDAFGDFDPEGIFLADLDKLGNPGSIRPGMVFSSVPGQADDGRRYTVTEIADGKAVLDCNHPLAGWTLKFIVRVLSAEPLDEESLAAVDSPVPDFLGFADKLVSEDD